MIVHPALHRIRTGEASAAEARSILRALIQAEGADASSAIYAALRTWTWNALQLRRFDDDMTEWYRVLRGAGAVMSSHDESTARYLEALSHLVEDSVVYGAVHSRDRLLARSHLGDILEVASRHNGRIGREQLEAQAGLKPSRLSQLLKDLQHAGFLEREAEGRRATFNLTESGRDFLDAWREAQIARAAQASEPRLDEAEVDSMFLLHGTYQSEDDNGLTLREQRYVRRSAPVEKSLYHSRQIEPVIEWRRVDAQGEDAAPDRHETFEPRLAFTAEEKELDHAC